MKYKIFFMIMVLILIFSPVTNSYALPTAKITLRVVDEKGNPIEGIYVGVGFEVPDKTRQRVSGEAVKGFTDSQGLFTAQNRSMYDVHFGADKVGYYKSRGSYQFKKIISGKLEPWNPTVELVFKKIEKPVPMYARDTKQSKLLIPVIGKEAGFDVEKFDWVPPYGGGKYSDLIFKLDKSFTDDYNYNSKLTITFSSKYDGIQIVKEDLNYGSEFKLPRYAPLNGYQRKLEKIKKRSPGKFTENNFEKDNNYIFRIRSEEEDGKLVKAMYGKIQGEIRFEPRGKETATIFLKYYLNPDYTRNLEFDPKRNLFKNLKSFERVGLN